jgi:cytochrome c-type biogenesis protein
MERIVQQDIQEAPPARRGLRMRDILGPLLVLTGALGLAVGGAFITGSEIGMLVGAVESLSADSGNLLGQVATLFPLGFAFSAGMVASVNPCGFVMLPAYLGLYMGDTSQQAAPASATKRLEHALVVGGTVTLGFVLMFALVGVPIGLGARGLVEVFPWIGFAIGVILTVVGAYMLFGGKVYTNWAARLSTKVGSTNNGIRGYLIFGIGYGIESLSCTLPIFLAVIGGAFTADTFLNTLLQFMLYGLGMGTVIMILTVGMAVFRGAMLGSLRRLLPHVGLISAVMLLLAGSFIVYYWLTIGELLGRA